MAAAGLAGLADELGCSLSWLTACRITSAAWTRRERRSVSWVVHRNLSGRPDRLALMAQFLQQCDRANLRPSPSRLRDWLDQHDLQQPPVAVSGPLRAVAASDEPDDRPARPAKRGRPRIEPLERVERLALSLDRESLAVLVERLIAALASAAA